MLWLVRHGESEANAGDVTGDRDSPPLTAVGRDQATRVASAFPAAPDRVVLSPYVRAIQTAGPLLARFPAVLVESAAVQEFAYLAAHRHQGTDAAAGSGKSSGRS
jgi:2,3-bisphosphoglycerate-dependent phosphoglycerate mutase